jgi:hypothetical protein
MSAFHHGPPTSSGLPFPGESTTLEAHRVRPPRAPRQVCRLRRAHSAAAHEDDPPIAWPSRDSSNPSPDRSRASSTPRVAGPGRPAHSSGGRTSTTNEPSRPSRRCATVSDSGAVGHASGGRADEAGGIPEHAGQRGHGGGEPHPTSAEGVVDEQPPDERRPHSEQELHRLHRLNRPHGSDEGADDPCLGARRHHARGGGIGEDAAVARPRGGHHTLTWAWNPSAAPHTCGRPRSAHACPTAYRVGKLSLPSTTRSYAAMRRPALSGVRRSWSATRRTSGVRRLTASCADSTLGRPMSAVPWRG